MIEISFNQITPRSGQENISNVKLHFTYTMDVGGETVSGSGALTVEDYEEYIDFEGLASIVRQKLIDNM